MVIKMALCILSMFFAFYIGYVVAHHEIASECKRLGGFYVGKETFKCVKVDTLRDPVQVSEGTENNSPQA